MLTVPPPSPVFQKYLSDPCLPVAAEDAVTRFEIPGTAILIGQPDVQVKQAFLSGLKVCDFNGDSREDILVPALLVDGRTVNVILINNKDFPGGHNNHFSLGYVLPSSYVPAANEPDKLLDVPIDLNGDGFKDLVDIRTQTGNNILFLDNIRINFGIALVTLGRQRLRDARLGYLAGYTQTLLLGLNAGSDPHSYAPQVQLAAGAHLAPSHPIAATPLEHVINLAQLNGPDAAFRFTHPELDFEVITRGGDGSSTPTLFTPDPLFYSFGLQFGDQRARADLNNAASAQRTIAAYSAVYQPFDGLTADAPPDKKAEAANQSIQLAAQAEAVAPLDQDSQVKSRLSALLNSPAFVPRRFSRELAPVGLTDEGLPLLAEQQITDPERVTGLLADLDRKAILVDSSSGEFIINTGRAVGMALAFLNLNVMRSDPKYSQRLLSATEAAGLLQNANDIADSLSPRLFTLSQSSTAALTGTNFLIASISSGYQDLSQWIANDRAVLLYDQGYLAGRQQALQTIKQTLGTQIPAVLTATTIEDAANAISSIIKNQQSQIDQLQDIIKGLLQTIDNLNKLLVDADSLINELRVSNQALRGALDSANQTIKDMGMFARAGTGFLMGGPIGAVLCVLFCH